MQGPSPSMEEIYEIAKNAAEEGAFEGLMYLERAQNSTKFSITARNRLAGVEQALFSQYKEDIPTSKRRFLHNLSLLRSSSLTRTSSSTPWWRRCISG